jgi:PTS system mannose-specific IID component
MSNTVEKTGGKLTKGDITSMFWRLNTFNFAFNAERMQAFGFLFTMIPALRRIYEGRPEAEKAQAMKRHLEFFNSQINATSLIVGVTAALEESTPENEKESVVAVKTSLMGPMAGLGDGLLKFTWLPICASIGSALALDGNPLGPVLMFVLFNLANLPTKWYGLNYGYSKGVSMFVGEKGQSIISRIANMANVLGLVVVGGMVSSSVRLRTQLSFTIGESALKIQPLFDQVIPSLLPVLLTLGCYTYLKKTHRGHLLPLIFGILIIGTILAVNKII